MTTDLFRLRPVVAADSRAIWLVANDPLVRQWAFHPEPIPWQDHQRWMARQLEATHPFFVVEDSQNQVAGYVRFALDEEGVYTVSIGLGESLRGRGLGAKILRQACQEVLQQSRCAKVLAWVKCDNTASLIAFLKAGFIPHRLEIQQGHNSLGLYLTPPL